MSKKGYNVAVVGATGVVGTEMMTVLAERKFPIARLLPLASEKSAGSRVYYNEAPVRVEELKADSFDGIDIALFSAGGAISEKYAPYAVKAGAVVVDNTSYFRMDPDVPLVVPEVNPEAAKQHKGIIANPNCSTAQMVLALKPIHDAATIERVVVSTYQSVSGAGKEAILELENQSRKAMSGQEVGPEVFPHTIAFNLLPQIDAFTDNGYTKEEMKMVNETKKILGDDGIQMSATCVRVPVFMSHSESINIQTKIKLTAQDVRNLIAAFPGIEVMDEPENGVYPTPRDYAGKDNVAVGRIREDMSLRNGIDMWCVGDNLRKGAALNAVQIAELLIA